MRSWITGARFRRLMICVIRARETSPSRANSTLDHHTVDLAGLDAGERPLQGSPMPQAHVSQALDFRVDPVVHNLSVSFSLGVDYTSMDAQLAGGSKPEN
jgi:hypothetical protein